MLHCKINFPLVQVIHVYIGIAIREDRIHRYINHLCTYALYYMAGKNVSAQRLNTIEVEAENSKGFDVKYYFFYGIVGLPTLHELKFK